eukprot:4272801-Pyramimonas_sp.AAC.1
MTTELLKHALPNLTVTTTPIDWFQISADRVFLEIRNCGEITKRLLRVGHDLPIRRRTRGYILTTDQPDAGRA